MSTMWATDAMVIGCAKEAEMIRFSDGVSINTGGRLRVLHLDDGWYVVGNGMLLPMDDEREAQDYVKEHSKEAE